MDACIAEPGPGMMDASPEDPPKKKHPTWAEREAAAKARVQREPVDFSLVPPSQWHMHDRLENWARWVRGRDNQAGKTDSPMFRFHKSDEWDRRTYGALTELAVDKDDAVRIAKGIGNPTFPDKQRRALNWYYLERARRPIFKARELAVSVQGLADLVKEGRFMLMNRGV